MKILKQRKKHKRGYPVAILVGMEETCAILWEVFSRSVKPGRTLAFDGHRKNLKSLYNFHESIISALRPSLKEGTRSIILVSPTKTVFGAEFVQHLHQHHRWLIQGPNKAIFSEIAGSAGTLSQVKNLTKSLKYHQLIEQTTSKETENLIEILEKRLSYSNRKTYVFFSIKEVENLILKKHKPGQNKPEYLLLTNKYLLESREKNKLNRIMQIAANKKIKTRVVNVESKAGTRISQLGGIVAILQLE